MTRSDILGFPSDDWSFYMLGKKYRLGSDATKSIALFLEIVLSATKARDSTWLIRHREKIKALERRGAVVELTRVVKCSKHDEVVRLAIWLRGRCGGSFGGSVVAAHCNSDSLRTRRAVARCLQRMCAWRYLSTMLEDPDENVRHFANQLPSRRSFEERLSVFAGRVRRRPLSHRTSDLLISPDVELSDPTPPRPGDFFRRLLLRIRRRVRHSGSAPQQ